MFDNKVVLLCAVLFGFWGLEVTLRGIRVTFKDIVVRPMCLRVTSRGLVTSFWGVRVTFRGVRVTFRGLNYRTFTKKLHKMSIQTSSAFKLFL